MRRLICCAVTVLVGANLLGSSVASAVSSEGIQFEVTPFLQFVQRGGVVKLAWTVTNNTAVAQTCTLTVEQTGFVAFSGTIAAGTSAGTGGSPGLVMPETAKRLGWFTLQLQCGKFEQDDFAFYIVVPPPLEQ